MRGPPVIKRCSRVPACIGIDPLRLKICCLYFAPHFINNSAEDVSQRNRVNKNTLSFIVQLRCKAEYGTIVARIHIAHAQREHCINNAFRIFIHLVLEGIDCLAHAVFVQYNKRLKFGFIMFCVHKISHITLKWL